MGYALRSFAHHVDQLDRREPLTLEVMPSGTARPKPQRGSHTWARRLKILRPFTRWLRQFEPPRGADMPSSPRRQRLTTTSTTSKN